MQIRIPGPAGQLEGLLTNTSSDTGDWAVLCHPHPRFGGSMLDAVLETAERALLSSGTHCVRFNFRGVGASQGEHDGAAEADDVAAVADWVRSEQNPERFTLAGYSFGAAMAWLALDRIEQPDRVLLIAPPVGLMELPERTLSCPVHVFAGDADQYVDATELARWSGVTAHTIAGADHFFGGQWERLEQAVREAL